MNVLLVCTANRCRSVMAEALLSARLTARGATATVASAGLLGAGQPPPAEVVTVLADRGLHVAGYRSRQLAAADLAAADLVLGLSREHVRHCAVLRPDAWPRTFTLRELVRRGAQAKPAMAGRADGRLAGARRRWPGPRDLLGRAPKTTWPTRSAARW